MFHLRIIASLLNEIKYFIMEAITMKKEYFLNEQIDLTHLLVGQIKREEEESAQSLCSPEFLELWGQRGYSVEAPMSLFSFLCLLN